MNRNLEIEKIENGYIIKSTDTRGFLHRLNGVYKTKKQAQSVIDYALKNDVPVDYARGQVL